MINKIKISHRLLFYIVLQRTNYFNKYFNLLPVFLKKYLVFIFYSRINNKYNQDMLADYNSMAEYFPKKISNILDIGCGIAGLDIYVYQNHNKPNIHLLDKTAMDRSVFYGFEKEGSYYNSLELARNFLVINGVDESNIFTYDLEKDSLNFSKDYFEVVVSTISWGFHYPVSTYAKLVSDCLTNTGVLILDVRKKTGGEEELMKYFSIEAIKDFGKYNRYCCRKK